MPDDKFRVGQLVRLRQHGSTSKTELYEVVHILPETLEGEPQYRLRGIYEWHERTAVARQISRAVRINAGKASGAGLA
jgi:hypothetical protein